MPRAPTPKALPHLSLPSLKAKELSILSLYTGLPTSGTKAVCLASLMRDLPRPRLRDDGPFRVLSVDMGIRNLAFACLDGGRGVLGGSGGFDGAARAGRKGKGEDAGASTASAMFEALKGSYDDVVPLVELVKWDRIGVSDLAIEYTSPDEDLNAMPSGITKSAHATPLPTPPTKPKRKRKKDLKIDDPALEPPVAVPKAGIVTTKESFTPATLAPIANHIITSILLPLRPTHILIERQRHRSGGGAAVLEWTFRVNMLESMLYAVLATLRARSEPGRTSECGNGVETFPEVLPMDPKRVSGYWTATDPAAETKDSADLRQEKHRKAARIAVAETWLRTEKLRCTGEAAKTAEDFLRLRRTGRRKSSDDEAEAERGERGIASKAIKRDDLADALCQGVAFVQWEVNRRKVCQWTGLG